MTTATTIVAWILFLTCLYATYLMFKVFMTGWAKEVNLDASLGRYTQTMEDLADGEDWWWEQYLESDELKGTDLRIEEWRKRLDAETEQIKERIRSKVGEVQKMAVSEDYTIAMGTVNEPRDGISLGNGYVLYPNEMRLVMMAGPGQEYDATKFDQLPTGEARVEFIDDNSIRSMEFNGNVMINTSRKGVFGS